MRSPGLNSQLHGIKCTVLTHRAPERLCAAARLPKGPGLTPICAQLLSMTARLGTLRNGDGCGLWRGRGSRVPEHWSLAEDAAGFEWNNVMDLSGMIIVITVKLCKPPLNDLGVLYPIVSWFPFISYFVKPAVIKDWTQISEVVPFLFILIVTSITRLWWRFWICQ